MKKDTTVEYIESFLNDDYIFLKKNLETLLKDYTRKSNRLDKIIKQSDKQQHQMMELNEELDRHKNDLEWMVQAEIQKRQEKEKMLLQQAKLASMGEMMDAVAHQWKQPISTISMQVEMMGCDFEDGEVDGTYIKDFQEQVNTQIEHMTSTLNEFRSFFRPSKDIVDFDVLSMVNKVLTLVKDEFMKNTIEIEVNSEETVRFNGVENELKHLLINLLNNAKDAFVQNNTKHRKIIINIYKDDMNKSIEVIDNAGGIPLEIVDDMFQANITTKDKMGGTGIGLYMSSQIAQKNAGTLSATNIENGAKFIFNQKTIDKDASK